ncbi:MAG: hypothetical protein ACKOZU_01510 [Planctomycetaceae bacterium]
MPRFIILEHAGAPDDPAGIHYDFLLEDGGCCRSWRLVSLPEPGGPPVAATELPPHRLAWLDHDAGAVSGGRGFARRIDAGDYAPELPTAARPAALAVTLRGARFAGVLHLHLGPDGWRLQLASQR